MTEFRKDKETIQLMGKCVDFVCELIDYIAEYPDDDYMTMECLCRKLFKYGLIDKKDGYYLVADGIKADRKTEPQLTEKCPFDDSLPCEWVCTEYGKCKYRPKTEPIPHDDYIESGNDHLEARCLNCHNAKDCKENHWEVCEFEPWKLTAVDDEPQTERESD